MRATTGVRVGGSAVRGASRLAARLTRRACSTDAAPAAAPPRRLPRAVALGLVAGGGYYGYLRNEENITLAPGEDVEDVDALIIGGGIMGASVGLMMKLLHPEWKIRIVEQLDRVGAESSDEWNNAGTGHAALCEPNYTPMDPVTKEVDISKAVAVNQKFLVSLQWWTWLVEKGVLPDGSFIQPAPHITFVHGEENREWLKKRVAKLSKLPTFAATEYSDDYDKIQKWASLLCSGRPREGEPIAASRHPHGTECNYGLLTRNLVQAFSELGGEVQLLSSVYALRQQCATLTEPAQPSTRAFGPPRQPLSCPLALLTRNAPRPWDGRNDKRWLVGIQKNDLSRTATKVRAKLVFAGAGGGSLRVLQKAGLPEVEGYAGLPISGKFLVCQKPEIVEQHRNKVYGRAAVGAPPMSVPHLDWRTIYGRDCIFFGPFAGFDLRLFKKTGGAPYPRERAPLQLTRAVATCPPGDGRRDRLVRHAQPVQHHADRRDDGAEPRPVRVPLQGARGHQGGPARDAARVRARRQARGLDDGVGGPTRPDRQARQGARRQAAGAPLLAPIPLPLPSLHPHPSSTRALRSLMPPSLPPPPVLSISLHLSPSRAPRSLGPRSSPPRTRRSSGCSARAPARRSRRTLRSRSSRTSSPTSTSAAAGTRCWRR